MYWLVSAYCFARFACVQEPHVHMTFSSCIIYIYTCFFWQKNIFTYFAYKTLQEFQCSLYICKIDKDVYIYIYIYIYICVCVIRFSHQPFFFIAEAKHVFAQSYPTWSRRRHDRACSVPTSCDRQQAIQISATICMCFGYGCATNLFLKHLQQQKLNHTRPETGDGMTEHAQSVPTSYKRQTERALQASATVLFW